MGLALTVQLLKDPSLVHAMHPQPWEGGNQSSPGLPEAAVAALVQ